MESLTEFEKKVAMMEKTLSIQDKLLVEFQKAGKV